MTQNEQIYFVSIESGRSDPCVQNTLGQLIEHMPMTISFEKEACAMERLRKLQTDFIASWNYDCYPTELLESKYGISNSIGFNYLGGGSQNGFYLSEHFIPMEFIVQETSHSNLIICVFKHSKSYELEVVYNAQAYKKSTIEKLMVTYEQMIDSFLSSLD